MPAALTYDCVLFFLRIIANIFFREIRPRGAWNIPKDGPVIFVAAPHNNQFLDPILLASEIHREVHRRVSFLIAAKSMKQRIVGFLAGLMNSSEYCPFLLTGASCQLGCIQSLLLVQRTTRLLAPA